MLSSASFYTLLAHDCMTATEYASVSKHWNATHREDSMPVLGMLCLRCFFSPVDWKGCQVVLHDPM